MLTAMVYHIYPEWLDYSLLNDVCHIPIEQELKDLRIYNYSFFTLNFYNNDIAFKMCVIELKFSTCDLKILIEGRFLIKVLVFLLSKKWSNFKKHISTS